MHISWTIAGRAADATSCAGYQDYKISLMTEPPPDGGEIVAFSPVPCAEGAFTIDKLPTRFWIVYVENREAGMALPFDAGGNAAIDMPY